MPFVPGNTVVGSFHAIPISLAKPGASSISTLASGKGNLCIVLNSLSLRTKKPVFKRDVANNPSCQWPLAETCGLSTSISARVLGPIWQLGTSIEPRSSDTAKKRVALLPPVGSSLRLCGLNLINPPSVFWIMDNCSAHRGQKAVDRIRSRWPNALLVHTPFHASWINQIEIYFSIVQRKVLTPNDFSSLSHLEDCLTDFQKRYEQTACPFQWTYTRQDLCTLLAKLQPRAAAPAA